MSDANQKSSAELEREIHAQRAQVESTIDQIQQRLSPGQLVDELLSYTKSGGGEFASNLGKTFKENPLPIALMGVSLAWLIAKPAASADNERIAAYRRADARWNDDFNDQMRRGTGMDEPPLRRYASVSGKGLKRLGSTVDDTGRRYSEFVDDAGKKFHALTDEAGNRAGHFIDEAGETYHGFVDNAGDRIASFRDEAGSMMEDASGWASQAWQTATEKLQGARDRVGNGAGNAGGQLRQQTDQLASTVSSIFRDQPLVGGALAFAIGAAIGATLPHTEQEDKVLGDAADSVKHQAGALAGDLYQQGKEKAADLYDEAAQTAGKLYDKAKSEVSGSGTQAPQ
jgi:ElaB/YqjD/DUF883 family membrane-anchored ribosome-binding protein